MHNLRIWLALSQAPGCTIQRLTAFRRNGGSLNAFCAQQKVNLHSPDVVAAERWLAEANHHFVHYEDPRYPELLKMIADPPLGLYVAGQLDLLKSTQLAIVGSRKASPQGLNNTTMFVEAACQLGLTITSGLALGIDGQAHRVALSCGGRTLAVLGSGLMHLYPRSHEGLAEEIMAEQGALVSEFPLQAAPARWHFPRRNRLISGLSVATLVVEASLHSGSLITATQAIEAGRDVFAVPGPVRQPHYQGCHHLIKQGAYLLDSPQELANLLANNPLMRDGHLVQTASLDRPAHILYNKPHPQLPILQQTILATIGDAVISADEIAQCCGLPLEKTLTLLTALELDQYINAVSGGYRLATDA